MIAADSRAIAGIVERGELTKALWASKKQRFAIAVQDRARAIGTGIFPRG